MLSDIRGTVKSEKLTAEKLQSEASTTETTQPTAGGDGASLADAALADTVTIAVADTQLGLPARPKTAAATMESAVASAFQATSAAADAAASYLLPGRCAGLARTLVPRASIAAR